MRLDYVTGAVVVFGMCLAILGLLTYGILDVARQYRGESPKPPTASRWLMDFFHRHPIAAFLAGLIAGILAGHWMWPQVLRVTT